MAGEAFLPTMGSISNRAFITKMEQWGWRTKKTSGDDTIMQAPTGTKVTVRSAHVKQGNSRQTFKDVLDEMGVNWERFIAPLSGEELLAIQLYLTFTDEEKSMLWKAQELAEMANLERVKQQQRAEQQRIHDERRQERKRERDRKITAVHKATITNTEQEHPVETQQPSPTADDPAIIPKLELIEKRTNGVSNDVLDVLCNNGGPMSTKAVAEALPQHKRHSVGGSLQYLATLGVAERVKTGVYRVSDSARRGVDYRLGIDVNHNGNGDSDTPAPVPASPPDAPAAVPATVPAIQPAVPPVAPTETEEDLINDTLDLLFPSGFKARHLPLIDAWRQATTALLRNVKGE